MDNKPFPEQLNQHPSHDFVTKADQPRPWLKWSLRSTRLLQTAKPSSPRSPKSGRLPKAYQPNSNCCANHLHGAVDAHAALVQGRKQQLPAPPTFDASKWENWKPYIKAKKIHVDGAAIGPAKTQFWSYAAAWMPGSMQWYFLWLTARPRLNIFSWHSLESTTIPTRKRRTPRSHRDAPYPRRGHQHPPGSL